MGQKWGGRLTSELEAKVRWLKWYFAYAAPRVLDFTPAAEDPVLIFTDGAVEGDKVTCGGVLVDKGRVEAFGCDIPEGWVSKWRIDKKDKQCIGQAELFPVLVSRLTWKERLRGRRVIFFIDNDSARFALIAMHSPVLASRHIIWEVASLDVEVATLNWYARVPTASNIADAPSRLDFAEVISLGGVVVAPVFPTWCELS